MKKTLISLRGKFNRFRTNNPIKTELGAVYGTAVAGILIAPLDMGATLVASVLAFPGTGLLYTMAVEDDYTHRFNHKNSTEIQYNGQTYIMTCAQANYYNELEDRKKRAKALYHDTQNKRLQKKLLKKAQKWSNIQDDLLDGANVYRADQKPQAPAFEVNRKRRTPGN